MNGINSLTGLSRGQLLIAGGSVLLIILALVSLSLGRYPVSLHDILLCLFTHHAVNENIPTIIYSVRLPRIIGAAIIGEALAISGAAYQGMFRNPMVSPDILGVSSGAGFGASLAILLSMNIGGIQLLAFICGLVARTISAVEIPLGILTAMIGAPFFLIFLKRTSKKPW
jgi:iron complex transport system permease protein